MQNYDYPPTSVCLAEVESKTFHEKQFHVETLFYFCRMKRKKWTPKEEVNDALLLFREKRKWQIALRRYVLEQRWGSSYAPYFGLDCSNFRKWIELQFDEETKWENFSAIWQFDHIVPVAYFDFNDDLDLRLCWNFINIRLEKISQNKNRGQRVDVLASKAYFERLYEQTGYQLCKEMVDKITRIEVSEIRSTIKLEEFILEKREYLNFVSSFSPYEFSRLNEGVQVEEIMKEREFLDKMQNRK